MSIGIAQALVALCPGAEWVLRGNEYSGLEWLDKTQQKPAESEVASEVARLEAQAPFDACKAEAKSRIAATDWSVLPDVGLNNKVEFETYRATLRGLIVTPVANPTWPTEPHPVWSK